MVNAIFISSSPSPKHLARLLETAQGILNKKEKLILIHCESEVSSCKINWKKDTTLCNQCISMIEKSKRLLDGEFSSLNLSFVNQYNEDFNMNIGLTVFKTLGELKSFRFKSYNVGMAVASTLITGINSLDVIEKVPQQIIRKKIISSIFIYEQFKIYIKKFNIDKIYVHNGRHAHQNAAIQAAVDSRIDFFCVESAYDRNKKFRIYENHLPHNFKKTSERIERLWYNSVLTKSEKEVIGEKFYIDRFKGKFINGYNHLKYQKKTLMPTGWDIKKKNFVLFNSSSFEFESINYIPENSLFDDEIDAIKFIANELQDKPDYHFYIRIHPNMLVGDERILKKYLSLSFENLTVIPPDSPIDSYQLAINAHLVIVSNSTLGVEASYMGIPAISISETFYQGLDVVYEPNSREMLLSYLFSNLKPKPKENALKYGFYMIYDGIPFINTKLIDQRVFYKDQELSSWSNKLRVKKPGLLSRLKKTLTINA